MRKNQILPLLTILIAIVAVVVFVSERIGRDQVSSLVPTRTASSTPTPIVTQTSTITPTDQLTQTATIESTDVYPPPFTSTPPGYPPPETPTVVVTVTITPTLNSNWLVNGRFDLGYNPIDGEPGYKGSVEGWEQLTGYWWNGTLEGPHSPLPCSPSGTWYLQMDRDEVGNDLWPPAPSADTIYQDVTVPYPHNILHIHYEEAHHLGNSEIILTIYGWKVEGEMWEIVYRQDGVRSPSGTGKCVDPANPIRPPPAVYDDVVDVTGLDYPIYRIEIYGNLLTDNNDAVLWGDFRLWGE